MLRKRGRERKTGRGARADGEGRGSFIERNLLSLGKGRVQSCRIALFLLIYKKEKSGIEGG